MIPKSGSRFSEKIMLKQIAGAGFPILASKIHPAPEASDALPELR
jgi:hypothetical protein